jgi:hypothetical protein
MSAGTVRVFLPTLQALDRELPLPIPERVRILRELEFDLEELRARLEAEGHAPEEAQRQALEALVPAGSALTELGHVHAPLYRILTENLRQDRLRAIERSLLAAATGGVLAFSTIGLAGMDVLTSPSPFLWLVLALGGALFAAIVAEAFRLWVKKDHRRPSAGLTVILAFSGSALMVGLAGVLIDFYLLAASLEADPTHSIVRVTEWLVRDAALLSISIVLALVGGSTWFLLTQWLTAVTDARRNLLGLKSHESRRRE